MNFGGWMKTGNIIDDTELLNVLQSAARTYQGMDLTQKFQAEIAASPFNGDPWAWIQARVRAGNFTGLLPGDFIPIVTTAGTPVTTFMCEIAGINTYRNQAGTPPAIPGLPAVTAPIPNHIDFISRDLFPNTVQWNLANYNNGFAATSVSPWNASHVFAWLNGLSMTVPNATTAGGGTGTAVDFTATAANPGLWWRLPTNLRNVIVPKIALMPSRAAGTAILLEDTTWAWQNIGNLWAPSETEVFGQRVWAGGVAPNQGWASGGYMQYPIFAGDMTKAIKGIGHQGARAYWWLSTPIGGSSTVVCAASTGGSAAHVSAAHTGIRAALCFRVA